jgi:hypothetical protein
LQEVTCELYLDHINHVARGKAYLSKEKQILHGDPMPANSLKVTITEALKENASLPYPLKGGGITTVGEALGTFIGWPTQHVKITDKVHCYLLDYTFLVFIDFSYMF